jgi:1-deoxy-D-xylulose-5-phosphate synthase
VGKAQMLVEGDDLLILAVGSMVAPSVEASAALASEGISAGVINARFIKPLDRDLILQKAAAAAKVLTVEEGVLTGGFGSAILELFADEGVGEIQVFRMGIPDTFVEHGTRLELLADFGLNAEGIAAKARTILEGHPEAKLRNLSYGGRRPH